MKSDNLFKHIKDYWILYAFIAQLIVSYSYVNTSLKDHEKRVQALEDYRNTEQTTWSDIQSRLASIETSLVFIKERLK